MKPNNKSLLYTFSFLLFTFALILVSCNMFNEPKGNNPNRSLTLNVEDASCTEAWIEVKFAGVEFPAELRFYVNDSLAESLTAVKDTLLYIEGLLPSQTYRVRAEAVRPQEATIKSPEAEVTTLDTTSHDFTWQTFTFGGANGSSYLRDVAIINENDIWAVGEIHTEDDFDSSGHYQPYNAVHWNGQEWELKRALFHYQGQLMFSDIRSILAFSANDIWFEAGIHWNGENFETKPLNIQFQSHVNAMWGTSSSDFYIVGDNGNIAHYDGASWERIESPTGDGTSGTETELRYIYGDYNVRYGQYEIIISETTPITQPVQFTHYYWLKNNSFVRISPDYEFPSPGKIWFKSGSKYYFSGSTALVATSYPDNWEPLNFAPPEFYSTDVTGNGLNDIFMVGDYGRIVHFNGISWKDYGYPSAFYGWYSKCSSKGDLVVAVGTDPYYARLIVGRR
jgi:hypothetical protein